jgi:hypothetical protein
VVLVVAHQVQDDRLTGRHAGERRQDPGREGVGVDGDGQGREAVVVPFGAELSQGLGLEQRQLLPEP